MILSIDPGESTGVALWTDKGTLLSRWIMTADETIDYLAAVSRWQVPVTQVVIEDFRLLHGKAVKLSGSRFPAIQVIGAARLFCRLTKAPLHTQSPGILVVAAMHSGVAQPSNHALSHDIDAYNHGYYWFETQGILGVAEAV